MSVWVGQHHGLMPVIASEEATKIDSLFSAMLAISTGLFLIVEGALLYSVFFFRRRAGDDTDALPIEGNVPLEILWTAIPTVIVMWLAVYSFDVYKSVDSGNAIGQHHVAHAHPAVQQVASMPGSALAAEVISGEAKPPSVELQTAPATAVSPTPLTVDVKGLQYAWIFTYPETGIVSGELRLPVGRPVVLNISANDVIHAFWVPEFRLKQDAIPGQENHLNFIPNRVGSYPLICAELCGAYHGGMKTRVIVQSPEDFQTWENSQKTVAAQDSMVIASSVLESPSMAHVHDMGLMPEAAELEHLRHQGLANLDTVQMAEAL
ncbi:MAG TPA: cytochrome c oxidase subunit II [Stenomitos sp.]